MIHCYSVPPSLPAGPVTCECTDASMPGRKAGSVSTTTSGITHAQGCPSNAGLVSITLFNSAPRDGMGDREAII
jgi:hypothetical protein